MSKDVIQKIHDASNGGLDIILSLCPEAAQCIDNKRLFKLRQSEKTASASIRLHNGVYMVKDFGGDFSGAAINLYMYLLGKDLKTAIKELGSQYQVLDDGKTFTAFMPTRSQRAATELEPTGWHEIVHKDELDQFELETIFSKKVIEFAFNLKKDDWKKYLNEVCARYSCAAVKHFSYVKDGIVKTTASNDQFPIFVFTNEDFKKLYQPLADKKFRFRTFGHAKNDHIWGYARAIKTHEDLVSKWHSDKESIEDEDADGKKKKYKEPKLPEVIICSGNGDSLNVAALGYNVIWQNSESAILPDKIYKELVKRAECVYNLPDIDSTGLREAHKMALRFMDLKTIYLPEELREKRDRRGNPCKDLRDYLNHWNKWDFDSLVRTALEYKFWDEEPQFDREGNFKKMNYVFNNVRAYNFIEKNGFYRIKSKTNKAGYEYIQVNKNVVKIIDVKDVKAFVNQFLAHRYTEDQRLRNTFYRMNQLKDDSLDNLRYVELDFKYFEPDSQFMFFENKTWLISGKEITEYMLGEIPKMVWEDKVIKHKVQKLDAPFTIKTITNADGSSDLDIEIHNNDDLFLRYLINSSRIYWRKELETACEEKYTTDADREEYRQKNKFNIAGPLLTSEEQKEQKLHLINKIYVLGYLLARHKEKSKPWAPFLMDHKLSSEGESNGGSGKTIFARSVEHFMNFLLIDGKSKSLSDDKHSFENVTELTEVILIDDLSRYMNIEAFFSMITEGMTINPKYTQRFIIPYERAPKIIFTSNYGVKDITSSAERRIIYAAFCDYYHNNSTGLYREDRTPANDFGKDLFSQFDEKEWNLFINTMACCLQFYFNHPVKVGPPMDNVQRRNLQGIMGDAFKDWADVYFSYENQRLDNFVAKQEAYQQFQKDANQKHLTPQRFGAMVEAWCKYYRYQHNPAELQNDKGRILRKWPVKKPDGTYLMEDKVYKNGTTSQKPVLKTQEMIYIKTEEGAIDLEKLKDIPEPTETQTDLPGIVAAANDDDPFK